MRRREFIRKITTVAYSLAAEADRETNLIHEDKMDLQAVADIAGACIDDLLDALVQAASDGLIDDVYIPSRTCRTSWIKIPRMTAADNRPS